MQVVAVPWGLYFDDTEGLVPWRWKAVPWEVVLCRYREGGTLGTALWRYRGDGTSTVPWEWYRGRGRRYRGVGTVGMEGGTVGCDVVQVLAVPWGWYFRGTVGIILPRYRGVGTVGGEGGICGRWCCASSDGTVGMVLRRYRGVGTVGGEGGTVGGGAVQIVAVP